MARTKATKKTIPEHTETARKAVKRALKKARTEPETVADAKAVETDTAYWHLTDDEILDEFRAADALLEGHFILSSGLRSSRYLQCARVLMSPARGARLSAARYRSVTFASSGRGSSAAASEWDTPC